MSNSDEHMSARQRRINFLARRNRCSQLQSDYLARLSSALGSAADASCCIDLAESDRLEAGFRAVAQQVVARSVEESRVYAGRQELESRLGRLESVLEGDVLFYSEYSIYCGAYRLPAKHAIRKAFELLLVSNDSTDLGSLDGANGLILDVTAGDLIAYYELYVWGRLWLSICD